MSYQALARKWRPQTFADVIGQESVVRTLQNAIEQARIHHAYLFSGVRGVGKTTAARIFAKAVNCLSGPAVEPCNHCVVCMEITEGIDLDVREIDAATYTQVDNIRELREVTQFQPARDRKRIFIIDEAHMLSIAAWNALLKLIEEPPPHVAFIMATTEMQKVPATILSRVQRLVFRKITNDEVAARLGEICSSEGIEMDTASLALLARRGEGSVRDSLSMLDQVIAFGGSSITLADVQAVLGLSDTPFFAAIVSHIRDGERAEILALLEEAASSGRDFKSLFRDLLSFMRSMLILSSGAPETVVASDPADLTVLREALTDFAYSDILRVMNLLMQDDELVTRSEHQRLAVEIALLKAATFPRLKRVEAILGGENSPARPAVPPAPKRESVKRAELQQAEPQQAEPQQAETRRTEPVSSTTVGSHPDGISTALLERVRAERRLVSSYLEQAVSIEAADGLLEIQFAPAQAFFVDSLSEKDQLAYLAGVAGELTGRAMTVRVRLREETPETANVTKNRLSDDPIVRAISKHLGGELIPPRRKRTEMP